MKRDKIPLLIWRFFLVIAGSTISAFAISFLILPHKLLTGGVSGASILLTYATDINPSIWIIALNIPLFIVAWKKIDLDFCIFSIIGTVSLSIALSIFMNLSSPFHVSDPLLASLFGGIISGGGIGIAIRARATQGGTDIISVVVRRKFSISIGMVNFYLNIIIVILLALKFGIEVGLLTLFTQYVAARSLDRVVTGFNTAKAVTIVSDRAQAIADYIMTTMYRGVTFVKGEGGYENRQKDIIWCVVTTSQLSRIKKAVKSIDPQAFITISNASEIVGKGFHNMPF